jgi:hypothetical protein
MTRPPTTKEKTPVQTSKKKKPEDGAARAGTFRTDPRQIPMDFKAPAPEPKAPRPQKQRRRAAPKPRGP